MIAMKIAETYLDLKFLYPKINALYSLKVWCKFISVFSTFPLKFQSCLGLWTLGVRLYSVS